MQVNLLDTKNLKIIEKNNILINKKKFIYIYDDLFTIKIYFNLN